MTWLRHTHFALVSRVTQRRCIRRGVIGLTLVAGCRAEGVQSVLDPASHAARQIVEIHWVLVALSTLVVLLVVLPLLLALVRRREFDGIEPPLGLTPDLEAARRRAVEQGGEATVDEAEGPRTYIAEQRGAGLTSEETRVALNNADFDRRSVPWILGAGLIFPTITLLALFVYALYSLGLLAGPERSAALTIEVVGRQFWWQVHYLDDRGRRLFETANEIHIPVGRKVELRLSSPDVIHSFWVPRLHGKLDMIPGRPTRFWIEADQPGTYRGQCAEYCGLQHAKMAFLVIAEPEEQFQLWLDAQRSDAIEPAEPAALAGRAVFERSACRTCHAVRGVTEPGERIGPDLTHLASRRTLAAVTIPNTRGHLGGWIGDPQAIKPGVRMPAVPLSNEEFHALLHYMMSLR